MNRTLYVVLIASVLSVCSLAAEAQDAKPEAGSADRDASPSVAVVQATPTQTDMKAPRSSNKWRIKFDESSKSDGTITFRVWTQGGNTVDVLVNVRNNQTENTIARAARDAFRKALGAGYKVETDDGEDVLVKASGKTPHFAIALVSSTAKDVDVELDRE